MENESVFKLPLSQGVQTIRLDEDSLDYDWKGSLRDFHGTLPYENLRMKMRVVRKEKVSSHLALVLGALILLLFPLVPSSWSHYYAVVAAVCLLNLTGYMIRQHVRSKSICVQIEPRPFGFSGELPIPDSSRGRAFLETLEAAWRKSLCRRFLVRDGVDPMLQLQRINWLQAIGVLTSDEAAAERALIDAEKQAEQRLIALN